MPVRKSTNPSIPDLVVSSSGISFNQNLAKVKLYNGESITLTPKPMDTYEQFYGLWCLMYSLADLETTLTYNWVNSQDFRDAAIDALNVFNIPALQLSPKQLEELLLYAKVGDETYPPILFYIHEDSPPVGKIKRETRHLTPQSSQTVPKNSQDSSMGDTSVTKFWGIFG